MTSARTTYNDPDEFLSAHDVWGKPTRFTPTKPFRAEVYVRDLDGVICVRTKVTPTILHLGDIKRTTTAFCFSDEGSPPTVRNGIEIGPSEIFVYTGEEYYHRADYAYGYRIVFMPNAVFAEPLATCRIRLSSQSLQWLRCVHIAAMRGEASQGSLVQAVLSCLASAVEVVGFRGDKQSGAIHKFIRDIHVPQDVNERTFRRYCNAHLGISPHEYIKIYRLNAVRQSLIHNSSTTKIADIAMENGFNHQGRFNKLYRQLFGETPTDTLRYRFF